MDRLPDTETDCEDNLDDDLDRLTDCLDPDCASVPDCAPACPDGTLTDPELPVTGTTIGRPDEWKPSCDAFEFGSPDYSVAFTAPADGLYGFGLDPAGTSFDAVLSLADSCGGEELDCQDAYSAGGGGDAVGARLTAGQSVVVVVDGYYGLAGDFSLVAFQPMPTQTCSLGYDDDLDGDPGCSDSDCTLDPVCVEDCTNGVDDDGDFDSDCLDEYCALDPACAEDCANGIDDDGDFAIDCTDLFCASEPACAPACPESTLLLGVPAEGSLVGLTDDHDGCVDDAQTADVTFAFTAPADGTYTFDTVGSAFDTVLYALDSCDGPDLACDDDTHGVQSEIQLELQAGQTVILVVDSWSFVDASDYVLNVR